MLNTHKGHFQVLAVCCMCRSQYSVGQQPFCFKLFLLREFTCSCKKYYTERCRFPLFSFAHCNFLQNYIVQYDSQGINMVAVKTQDIPNITELSLSALL